MTVFEYKDFSSTIGLVAKTLIRPFVPLPSKTKVGTLVEAVPSVVAPSPSYDYLKENLKFTKGSLHLPPCSLLDLIFERRANWHEDADSRLLALKVFLYCDTKITLISPESWYDGCSVDCPKCDDRSRLVFAGVNYDTPKVVMGLTQENEVVITVKYKCEKRKHTFTSLDPQYRELLPPAVQARYPYYVTSSGSTTVLNSNCCWSMLRSKSLSPVYDFIEAGKIYQFGQRVEKYLLYVSQLPAPVRQKFPLPPTSMVLSKKGGVNEYFCPSELMLREIRWSGHKRYKDYFVADMQLTKVHDTLAFDAFYKTAKIAKSSVNHLSIGVAKDGADKGRVFAYDANDGDESHEKSALMYDGLKARFQLQGSAPKTAVTDKCCEGLSLHKVKSGEHPLSRSLGLTSTPKGDPFHFMMRFDEDTRDCFLSKAHRRAIHNIIFEDLSNVNTAIKLLSPGWKEYFFFIDKSGSLQKDFPWGQCEQPNLFSRKLIALAHCFDRDLPSYLNRSENAVAKMRCLIKKAVQHLNGARCEFVPQVFRSQTDMLEALREYSREWFGFDLVFDDSTVSWDFTNYTPASWIQEEIKLKSVGGNLYKDPSGNRHVPLVPDKNGNFRDARGIIWRPTIEQAEFHDAPVFQPGMDNVILGRSKLPKAVLNLGKHILKGCLDYAAFGDALYQEVGAPLKTPSKFAGLVRVETAAGENLAEAIIKTLNQGRAFTSVYSTPELEARTDSSILERNRNVDIKNGRSVAPTAQYWYWSNLNRLSSSTLGSEVFVFRDASTLTLSLPKEHHLGFNSFRFTLAIKNKKSFEESLEHSLVFTLPKSSKFRWPKFAQYEAVTPAMPITSATASRTAPIPASEAAPATSIDSLSTSTTSSIPASEAAPTTSIDSLPTSTTSSIPASEAAPTTSIDSLPTSTTSTIPASEAAPANDINAAKDKMPIQLPKSRVRASNASVLTRLLPLKPLKKPSEKALLKSVVAEVVAEQPDVLTGAGVQSKRLCSAVAVEINKRSLSAEGEGAKLGGIVSSKIVEQGLLNLLSDKQSASNTRKRKRNHHAKVEKSWTLGLAQLLKGDLSYELLRKQFSVLRGADCATIRGNRKSWKGLTKTKAAVLFGLRSIFSINQLERVKYDGSTQDIVVEKSLRRYTFKDRSTDNIHTKTTPVEAVEVVYD